MDFWVWVLGGWFLAPGVYGLFELLWVICQLLVVCGLVFDFVRWVVLGMLIAFDFVLGCCCLLLLIVLLQVLRCLGLFIFIAFVFVCWFCALIC